MRHQHTFRNTRRARCVHDVGDAFAGLRQCQVGAFKVLYFQAIEVNTLRSGCQRYLAVGQQNTRLTVFDHERLTFDRCIDVQRYVHRRALEHRQLTGEQVMAALQQDRHTVTWLHAKAQQMPRKTIGAGVEFGIAHGNAIVDRRASFRARTHLGFEQAVHGLLLWVVQRGVVERHQQLLPLGFRHHRQVAHR